MEKTNVRKYEMSKLASTAKRVEEVDDYKDLSLPPSSVFERRSSLPLSDSHSAITKHRDLGLFIGWREVEWVRAAIKDGASTNTPREYAKEHHIWHSPLHLAVLANYAEVVPLLVGEGNAEVDARSHMYPFYTPLQLAAAGGKAEMVKILLSYGANPKLVAYLDDPKSCLPYFRPDSIQIAKSMNQKEVVLLLQEYVDNQEDV